MNEPPVVGRSVLSITPVCSESHVRFTPFVRANET